MQLNEIQIDLLKEAFNMGVGQAANALSEIAGGEEIILSVPELELKTIADLIVEVRKESGDDLCGVSERFSGPFNGRAVLLYSQEESLELVRIMLGETIPVEQLSEMEGEALCEVGNIVLNACISSLANIMAKEITTEIPRLHLGACETVLLTSLELTRESQVIHLRMNFHLAKHQLSGHIGFILELASMEILAEFLDEYFRNMLGG